MKFIIQQTRKEYQAKDKKIKKSKQNFVGSIMFQCFILIKN